MRRNQRKRNRKKYWVLCLLLLCLLGVGGWYYRYQSRSHVPVISADLLPKLGDAKDQNISERAQELADADYFTLQINPEAVFEDGRSTGSIEIVNPGSNVYPIAVSIVLKETEKIIYSSGAIYPNQFIENVKLDQVLAEGTYPAVATITLYDPDTKEKQGVTEAELTILVKN